MAISVREDDLSSVAVLDLRGRINLGEGSVTLRDTARKLLDEGRKKIVLNLALPHLVSRARRCLSLCIGAAVSMG